MKVHKKDSPEAKRFNNMAPCALKQVTVLFMKIADELRRMEPGDVLELPELSPDYQTSNLRKALMLRGIPGEAFTCRRLSTDPDGNVIPPRERGHAIIKNCNF